MPIRIKSSALKSAAKLTSRIKQVNEPDDGVLYWSTVHRLVATPDELRLLTTDKDIFLDWSIDLDGTDGDQFDVIVPAVPFNAVASNAFGGSQIEVCHDADVLSLSQKKNAVLTRHSTDQPAGPDRLLRIRTGGPTEPYPPSPECTGTSWTTEAQPLSRALAFVAPFINPENPDPRKSIASWMPGGGVISGSPQAFGFVTGLDSPPVSLNLKQDNAKVVSAFLEALQGQVEIDVSDTIATFRCPTGGHTLVVPVEEKEFLCRLQDLEGTDHEYFRTDNKSLVNGLNTLGALLPREGNALEFRLSGEDNPSAIYLATPIAPHLRSNDVIPLGVRCQVRYSEDEGSPTGGTTLPDGSFADTTFLVPWEPLRDALKSLDSATVELKYFPQRPRGSHDFLRVYSVEKDAQDPVKSVLLQVGKGTLGGRRPASASPEPQPGDDGTDGPPISQATDGVNGQDGGLEVEGHGTRAEEPGEESPRLLGLLAPTSEYAEDSSEVAPPSEAPAAPTGQNGTGGRSRVTRQR